MIESFGDITSYADLSAGIKASIVITSFLIIATMLIGLRVKKLKTSDVPGGITLVSIMFVEVVNNMVGTIYGKKTKKYAPLLLTILLYLLFANTVTLFGLSAPLANITIALSFSLFAFVTIQIAALLEKKPKQRAKDLLDPHPAFLAINLIGEMSTPLAMGLRLFGNLLSGSIIGIIIFRGSYELSVAVFEMIPIAFLNGAGFGVTQILGLGVGAFIHAVFDIFFGAIQAYVYFMLFSIFMGMAVKE